MNCSKGFTIIELVVVIAIISVLSGIIMFSVTQYISKGKDSNISGNLAVLVPAGEVYYNGFPNAYGDSDNDFCTSNVVENAIAQMPPGAIFNCNVDSGNNYQSWAACAQKFTDSNMAFCVDSRGVKKEMCSLDCSANNLTECPEIVPEVCGS